jgi:hypothetical protein
MANVTITNEHPGGVMLRVRVDRPRWLAVGESTEVPDDALTRGAIARWIARGWLSVGDEDGGDNA